MAKNLRDIFDWLLHRPAYLLMTAPAECLQSWEPRRFKRAWIGLMALSLGFLVCALGLGLLISTLARTQLAAVQAAFLVMLPSVLLSGFMFPRSEMPLPIYLLSFCIPVTYFLEMLRGIVLRGADLVDLAPHVAGLAVCTAVVLGVAIARFRKQLG